MDPGDPGWALGACLSWPSGTGEDELGSWRRQTVLRQDPRPRNQQPGALLPQAHGRGGGLHVPLVASWFC